MSIVKREYWYGAVRKHPRYYAFCAKCGKEEEKRFMSQIYIKDGAYSPMRILCHICERCLPVLLDELEVCMPE